MSAANPFSLSGKTIVVTGASSGIGRQCAITCSQLGATLILIGRDEGRLEETMQQLEGNNHLRIAVDITDTTMLSKAIANAVSQAGKVHGLVNAAGVSPTLPFRVMSETDMVNAFNTNVIAAASLAKILCKPNYAAEEGMSLVFITSVMGSNGEAGKSLYGMTKGALIAGVKSLALEYASRHIRFNCISPAVVISPMSAKSIYSQNEEALGKVKALHPLGLGMPEDVANAAVYLLSEASKWVTGINLIVDGGYTAR